MLLFAALMLASTPGLAGHGHHMHAQHAYDTDTSGAQMDAGIAGLAPAAAICMRVAAGSTVAVASASDEHRHHPCGSHDAGCKRISSCVSCVSAIVSTSAAIPLPYAVRAVRKASNAAIPSGIPPAKLQRPPRLVS
ncbi:MAG: hypothetical protein R3D69_11895 [Xanthobacteraceae bacterium]